MGRLHGHLAKNWQSIKLSVPVNEAPESADYLKTKVLLEDIPRKKTDTIKIPYAEVFHLWNPSVEVGLFGIDNYKIYVTITANPQVMEDVTCNINTGAYQNW